MKHWNFNGEPWCHTHALKPGKYELTKSEKKVTCKSCLKIMKLFKMRCKRTEKELRASYKSYKRAYGS